MAPVGARPEPPVAGCVARGEAAAPSGSPHGVLADALGVLAVPMRGRAVVLARLSPPTPVSADLVGALVDILVEGGCDEVVVGASLASRDRDRGHRSALALAHAAGLTGRTGRGRRYAVTDLLEDVVPAPVVSASVLAGQPISRLWLESPTRVVLARVVTDLLDGYAAGLATLLGAVPQVAGASEDEVCVDLLRCARPSLTVVDALGASVGADGGRIAAPLRTETLIVATDPVSADGTVARLLGEDRSVSRLVEAAVARLGEPTGAVLGDLTPWPGVTVAHPRARRAARQVAADARLARALSAATGGPDEGAESADPVLSAVRTVVTPAVRAAHDPVGQAALVTLLGAVATAAAVSDSWSGTFDKDRVERRVVSLGFDPGGFSTDEFDALPAFFAPFEAVLAALPESTSGARMRWTLVDGATVFEVSREIGADFDEFVARVDVAEGISLMADYLGGRRVTVCEPWAPDPADPGTTRSRQAERNLYLPQPNYLAAWGGRPIDVCKIELVERGPDEHRLTWRTVASPNGSATHDDGSLTLSRTERGTMATVRGRQLFTVPAIVDAIDLPSLPELRDPLLEDAYRRFFTTTFDNLEACFEGRDFRIGRPPPDPGEPLLTEALQLVWQSVADWARGRGDQAGRSSRDTRGTPGPELDADGFRHVRGPR